MKRIIPLVLALFMMLLLTACCNHSYKAATCTEPKTCTKCGETVGEPLGHVWEDATCENPKKCSVCGATEGKALGHDWVSSSSTGPSICSICGLMQTVPEPKTGEIIIGTTPDYYNSSTLTINNSASSACFIKLKDKNGNDRFGFYVRAGDSITETVPAEQLYVYFASGEDWYGPDYCFGEDTYYSKDDEIQDFYNYTITYTLYPVTDGNFKETPVSESEF